MEKQHRMVDTVAFAAATRPRPGYSGLSRFDFINKQLKMFNRMTEKCGIYVTHKK